MKTSATLLHGLLKKYFLFPEAMEGTDGSGPSLLSKGVGFLFTVMGDSVCFLLIKNVQ